MTYSVKVYKTFSFEMKFMPKIASKHFFHVSRNSSGQKLFQIVGLHKNKYIKKKEKTIVGLTILYQTHN